MRETVLTLLTLGASGSVLGLLLLILRRLCGVRLPNSFYYYAWLLVLLRFLLPLPGLIPLFPAQDAPQAASVQQQAGRASLTPAEDLALLDDAPARGAASEDDAAADGEKASVMREESPAAAAKRPSALAGLWPTLRRFVLSWHFALSVWAGGALASAVWYIVGYRRFARAIRRTEREPTDSDLALYFSMPGKRKPGLVRSRAVSSPMLMGVLRPTLVLPNRAYTPAMLRNIFRHELTHFYRGDILYKWFAALVFSLHWINPLAWIFRREIDRTCELSCDEQLLKTMSTEEKRNYGETLLALAARRPLPDSVIATSFATQKRNLKERLEQIMTYQLKSKATLALVLAAILLLAGCGAALGPNSTPQPAQDAQDAASIPADAPAASDGLTRVTVSTVDEFLAAIASDTVITFTEGTYDLSTAADYGKPATGNYLWADVYDGYQLNIQGVENLTLVAQGEVTLAAIPRYANVLCFKNASNISLNGLTLGHTEEPGSCAGGVLYLDNVTGAAVSGCKLYGCGVIGIWALNSSSITADDCDIYDCSDTAVSLSSCMDVRVTDSRIYRCGENNGYGGVFRVDSCTGFAAVNTEIYENTGLSLLTASYSDEVYLLGCDISRDNVFASLFSLRGNPATVDRCGFAGSTRYGELYSMDSDVKAVTADGSELTAESVTAMQRAEASYDGPRVKVPPSVEKTAGADGRSEAHVKTVDEFLAAIGPDTVIYLEAPLFDLSTATGYGGYGSTYYAWANNFDGPGLIISGADNLSIISEDECEIAAIPRYADVLSFSHCDNLTLQGFTAGHTEEPGYCSGGVLSFLECEGISIDSCRLYGCGIIGISTMHCKDLLVNATEIYDCSYQALSLVSTENATFTNCDMHDCGVPKDGSLPAPYNNAVSLNQCSNIAFTGCSIRDCGTLAFTLYECDKISYDGTALTQEYYQLENGVPTAVASDPDGQLRVEPAA